MMPGYDTLQKANNKGDDQTARMRRLVYAFVVRKPPKTGFPTTRPIYDPFHHYFLEIKIITRTIVYLIIYAHYVPQQKGRGAYWF